jgi:drug/metabolite transporter (DMT)-like permease
LPTDAAAEPGTQARRTRPLLSSTVLTITALIWGLAFVAQRLGMESIGPFMFVSLRMLLGALTLGLVVVLIGVFRAAKDRRGLASGDGNTLTGQKAARPMLKRLLVSGAACGTVLFVAASLQQVGMVYTEASKAGFLTALYIVLVPILGIALRNKTHWNTWISVALAIVGLYFLSIADSLTIQPGDVALLVGALFWACHILVIDRSVIGLGQSQVMRLCVVQFAVAAVLALLAAPFLDGMFSSGSFELQALVDALPTVLYVGVLSTGVAFTLQAIGQQGLNPSAASIIMSMEAVFSVFGGMLLLQETMTGREIAGCILMLAAVILSQLPVGRKASKKP